MNKTEKSILKFISIVTSIILLICLGLKFFVWFSLGWELVIIIPFGVFSVLFMLLFGLYTIDN